MTPLIENLTKDLEFNTARLEELNQFLEKQLQLAKRGFKSTLPNDQLQLLFGERVFRRQLVDILTKRLEYTQSLVV